MNEKHIEAAAAQTSQSYGEALEKINKYEQAELREQTEPEYNQRAALMDGLIERRRVLEGGRPPTPQQQALSDVVSERNKQRAKWGDAHDDDHGAEELARQAASFLQTGQHPLPYCWAHKSKVVDRDPRLVQLVKGAALALAAIEAHIRAESRNA